MTTQIAPQQAAKNNHPPDTHISFSQIKTYSMCSLKWWYSRRYKADCTPSALVFGKAWHAAVEEYYQQLLQGTAASASHLQQVFTNEYQKNAVDIQYGKTDGPPTEEQVGTMLTTFLQAVKPGKVIAIEQEIRCRINDSLPELLGYIDLIELVTDDSGTHTIHLVDFKTCARDPKDSLDADQLLLYYHAVKQIGLLREFNLPIRLRFDYLIKTKNPGYGSLIIDPDSKQIERVLAKVTQCWRGMASDVTYPCPGWQCSGCGYKSLCSKWPQTLQASRAPVV